MEGIVSFMSATAQASKGHIFLSHAGADTDAASGLVQTLRRNGLKVWFDRDDLLPGDRWMETIERNIERASAMVVYVGHLGVPTWVDREVRLGLERNTLDPRAFRLIPVLGEGAEIKSLPPFLRQNEWVDLRDPQQAPEQIHRLIKILRERAEQRAILPEYWQTHSPFRSLQVFEPEDSWLFFGRDENTKELLSRLSRTPVLAVVANSGSGKSSLLRAGLIPALQRGRFRYQNSFVNSWRIAVFRPSEAPFDNLAEVLPRQIDPKMGPAERASFIQRCRGSLPEGGTELRDAIAAIVPTGTHVLLVVDQFEEIFTLTSSKDVRAKYVEGLLAAGSVGREVHVHLVLALRADFYAHCLEFPGLSQVLQTNLYNLPGMSIKQLFETVEKRLALAGANAETGLINSLLAEVGQEPGDLALLEHALGQLWAKRGTGNTLTNQAYIDMGRLRGALGKHADQAYRELGTEEQKKLAQRIFLELVQLGDRAPDARRRVPKEVLLRLGAPGEIEQLLAHLASNRLIITGGEGPETFVEVSHEALIREWPVLRQWLAENRDDLRLKRRLEDRAHEWGRTGRDPGALLHGVLLAQAEQWMQKHRDVTGLLKEFMEASVKARAETVRKEEEAQARKRRSAQWFRMLTYALGILLALTIGFAGYARHELSIAQSRALAAQAEQTLNDDQAAALARAVRGWQTAKTSEARLAVTDALLQTLWSLQGHASIVVSAVYSPDGRRILTASEDGTAQVWNAINGRSLVELKRAQNGPLESAVFSPDGQYVVTASIDKTARIWNSATGQLVALLEGHTDRVYRAMFSPDGQHVVTASDDHTVRVWNAIDGKLLFPLIGHTDGVLSAVFSSDGSLILTAGRDHTARVWDANSGKLVRTLNGHDSYVNTAIFSPDGRRILTASFDQTARVWDATSGQLLLTLKGHTGNVSKAVFSPDGQRIATASYDNTARIWNATTGQLVVALNGHRDAVLSVDFSSRGQFILTGSADRTARLWNAASGQWLATLKGHTGRVGNAVFSPDGHNILTASSDTTARIWNAVGGQLLEATLEGHTDRILNAAFSPDGKRVVTTSRDKTVGLWDTVTGKRLATLQLADSPVRGAVFSHDGQIILTHDGNTVRIWSAVTGKSIATLEGYGGRVWSAVFSPDGQRIATASDDKTIRVWDAVTGKELFALRGHTQSVRSAVFSSDGQRILSASEDGTALIWDIARRQTIATLDAHAGPVWNAEFFPDGTRVMTFSGDKTVRIWNGPIGQLMATLEDRTGSLVSAEISPNGQRIVTTSANETAARLWSSANGRLITVLGGHASRVLSATFSSGGQRVLTAGFDNSARVWNAADGQLLAILRGHTGPVRSAVFSPDGKKILTSSDDKTARIWRPVEILEIAQLLH